MSNILLTDVAYAGRFQPPGLVSIRVFDTITGRDISRVKLPTLRPNTACVQAKIMAAHTSAGDSTYAISRIEWGTGHTTAASYSDTNLETPLYTSNPLTEGVFSPVTHEFPTIDGQTRYLSELNSSTPGLAAFETPSVDIWEVGLRTAALPGFPKGLLVARFVNDAPIQKSGTRTKIGIEWLYIYA
jgi:hypothetical protein